METRGNRTGAASQAALSGLSTGPGTGLRCDACRLPIESIHVECRCSDTNGNGRRFHQWCYYARSTGQ
jgi:hypothetical protein